MAVLILTAALWVMAAACPAGQQSWKWRESTSLHFAVAHEAPWAPNGFLVSLEKMHGRLRMDLGMFTPWMAKERVKLFLYKDVASYRAGEFNPPAWSNGLALYELKAVAVPDNPDRKNLMQVISHEVTHMLFRNYWQEAKKEPPAWLNEGLAMMEEAEAPDHPERTVWYQQMAVTAPASFMPMEKFAAINPATDLRQDEAVKNWYVQAYSVVYFLYRGHQRLQFKNLCAQLRDGKSLDESLWLAYRFHGAAAFEKAWRQWLGRSEHRNRVEAALAAEPLPSAAETPAHDGKPKDRFAPTTIKPMNGFKSLRE
ncbi:MAG TPA: hypothetical protein DEB40_13495 [Elusimicrobia bacterium]|nr:hypothetical protein [Elusimicrobiota bacterium]HBT62748.1 hypothetical protein [Elusimicrobiota bacterium]